MKNFRNLLRISVLILLTAFTISSCIKDEDPYAQYTQEREDRLISEWHAAMTAAKKDIDTTSTGLFYIMDKVGTGDNVKSGDTLTVKYTGLFMDGTIFDASAYRGDGTMTYIHKANDYRMIQGWEEGIEVLSKGGIGVFCIPSAKGYGTAGYSSIPPYSPLIFVIEVVNIK